MDLSDNKAVKLDQCIKSPRGGLAGYTCLRACFIWMLTMGALYYTISRTGLMPLEVGDGYLPEFLERFLLNPFYQMMGIAFLGVFGYGVTLWCFANTTFSRWNNSQTGTGKFLARLIGVPPEVSDNRTAWHEFSDFGLAHAASPIRDAAALFPGLGFLGTVVGVSIAIGGLEPMMSGGAPDHLLGGLRTAFDTTFIGLAAALCLGLLSMVIAATESRIGALRAANIEGDTEA